MTLLKKLALAPLFLLSFATLVYQLSTLIGSTDFIFSLSLSTLVNLVVISVLFSLSCFLFILFATLAVDFKFTTPVATASSLLTFIFLPTQLAVIFAVVILASLAMASLSLTESLKTYLTFKPEALLGPVIRRLSTYLILAFCLIYYFSANVAVAEKGFEIPDSFIDTALKVASPSLPKTEGIGAVSLPSIPKEQIEMLKKNPDLLKQYGLDPKILDTLSQTNPPKTAGNLTSNLIKQAVKDQIQNFIKPFLSFIPGVLAVLLFLTLQSLTSIINLLIYPLLWLTFLILEKTGFIRFEIEMREVKKLVV